MDAPRGSTQHPRRTAPHLYAPQLEALFETLDSNQTGSLSLDEFQQFLESIQCKHTRKQVRAAMKQAKARRGLSRAAEVALTAAMKPPRELKEVVLRHTTSRLYRQRRTQRRAAGDVVDPAAMERALLKLLSEAKFEELLKSDMCKAGGVERAGFGAAIRMARNGQKPKKVPPLPQGKQHLDVGKRDNMLLLLVDIMDPEVTRGGPRGSRERVPCPSHPQCPMPRCRRATMRWASPHSACCTCRR